MINQSMCGHGATLVTPPPGCGALDAALGVPPSHPPTDDYDSGPCWSEVRVGVSRGGYKLFAYKSLCAPWPMFTLGVLTDR